MLYKNISKTFPGKQNKAFFMVNKTIRWYLKHYNKCVKTCCYTKISVLTYNNILNKKPFTINLPESAVKVFYK